MVEVRARLLDTSQPLTDHALGGSKYLELAEPFLAVVSLLLAEGKINQVTIPILSRRERNHVLYHVTEILATVFVFART